MNPLARLTLERTAPLPLPIVTYPGAALIGARPRELVTDARRQSEAQAALHERYHTPVVLSAMDLSAESEAFGCEILMSDEDPPTVVARRVTNRPDAEALPVPTPGAARTGVYLETVRRLRTLPRQPLVLGGMIGPFSLAARLFGVSETMELTVQDPDLAHLLVQKSTTFLQAYAQAFKQAGAAGVIMAEPTSGLLSPPAMAAYSSAYIRQIVAAVDGEDFTLILHNCAAKPVHLPAVFAAGAKAYHFGAPMQLPAALALAGPEILICGNLDPTSVFCHGTTDTVRNATRALLLATQSHRNFVISSGCDIPARTPLSNLDAFFAELRLAGAPPAAG